MLVFVPGRDFEILIQVTLLFVRAIDKLCIMETHQGGNLMLVTLYILVEHFFILL